ncbi:helix-turn-helix domain-containing protein [Vacuolonema iberomarrocanum]|uniref:helix-turn-helix domain-containing protein n=1 Tax=Vacuolonema iberomarrocanum TaxID=3454632 RepID=UPI001A025A41|nr:helix-turn-helix domain-containing protein [filamentous cyanobacterium LEGE 07170]
MASSDFTERLRSHLQTIDIPSFQALCRMAQVSKWQVNQLRQGNVKQMRVDVLQRLSAVLQMPLPELIDTFFEAEDADVRSASPQASQQTSSAQMQQDFQQATLQVLESLLIQLPTVRHSLERQPDMPAQRLLPLLRPLDQLLEAWGIEAIAPVGSEIPYDPTRHQLMDGTADVGERVRVRYTGYMQGDRLLYRAKVSPIL